MHPDKHENPSSQLRVSAIIQTLNEWKHEFDKIEKLADLENITRGKALRQLLLAYRGEDDSATASLKRIATLVQDGMILYYYLKMFHYVFEIIGPRKRIEWSNGEAWKASQHGKEALVCALHILRIAESKKSSNPLIWYALNIGLEVTTLSLSGQKCECLAERWQHAADQTLQQWSDIGKPIRIDDTTMCVCNLGLWTQRIQKIIQCHKSLVE